MILDVLIHLTTSILVFLFVVLQVVNMSTGKKRPSLGRQCSVYGCTNYNYDTEGVLSKFSFFQIPKYVLENKALRDRWGTLIRRQDGKDRFRMKAAYICSKHFQPGDLTKALNGKRGLKPGTEPSLFEWNDACIGRKSSEDRSIREPFAELDMSTYGQKYLEPNFKQVTIAINIVKI
jgi:hypothetical protein